MVRFDLFDVPDEHLLNVRSKKLITAAGKLCSSGRFAPRPQTLSRSKPGSGCRSVRDLDHG
jgi:hypothetical protein